MSAPLQRFAHAALAFAWPSFSRPPTVHLASALLACSLACSSRTTQRDNAGSAGSANAAFHPDVLPTVPLLAVEGPAPSETTVPPTPFGVRWRTALPGDTPIGGRSAGPVVIGTEIFAERGDIVAAIDLATGKRRLSRRIPHDRLIGTRQMLVVVTEPELLGLDPTTLLPVWRAPASRAVHGVGDWLVEDTSTSERSGVQLRSASGGHVVWKLEGVMLQAWARPRLDGKNLYLPLAPPDTVQVVDVDTGTMRWQESGTLVDAAAGRVVIASAADYSGVWPRKPSQARILDRDGRERFRVEGARLLLHGNIAYASTKSGLTAIDLATNAVKWRRSGLIMIAGDDKWIYAGKLTAPSSDGSVGATDAPHSPVLVLSAATGAVAGALSIGTLDGAPTLDASGAVVVFGTKWLFALGSPPVSVRRAVRARGCLIVHGCDRGSWHQPSPAHPRGNFFPGNSQRVIGTTVTIEGVSTITDQRGCFDVRVTLGAAPARFDVAANDVVPIDRLDEPFPFEVVFDGSSTNLFAAYIGAGCHDSEPGGFP